MSDTETIEERLRAFVAAVDDADWQDVLRRTGTIRRGESRLSLLARRRPRMILAFAAALVLVPSALAFGGRFVSLFEGTPPTPPITERFTDLDGMAERLNVLTARQGFAAKVTGADPATAHGVLQLQTGDGPLDLWAATSITGGLCWFVDWEVDQSGSGPATGGGACAQDPPPPSHIDFAFGWSALHSSMTTLVGHVYLPAETVRVTLADGSSVTLPVAEGLFLGAFDRNAKLASISASDHAGIQVAEWRP